MCKTYYDIRDTSYDDARRQLRVTVGSRIYLFEDISSEDYEAFKNSSDKSAHFEYLKRSFVQLRDT